MNRAFLMACLASTSFSLVAAFADEPNSVQLRKMPPNGGNINNGPEVVDVVTVNTPAGPVRINASDYDPAQHTLADGQVAPGAPAAPPAAPVATPPSNTPPDPNAPPTGTPPPAPPSEQPAAPPAPPAAPADQTPPAPPTPPAEKFVTQGAGNKWFVTDDQGKAIDPAHPGFATKKEAQDAAKA